MRNRFYRISHDGKIQISIAEVVKFWQGLGFRKLRLASGKFQLVQIIRGSIIRVAEYDHLMQAVKYQLLEEDKVPGVWETFLKRDYVNRKTNLALDPIMNPDLNINTSSEAYFYFKNGVIKLTANEAELIPYENFAGFIMEDQIIKHDISLESFQEEQHSDFDQFVRRITSNNEERYQQLSTVIGYLMHGYKDQRFSPAVILVDENLDFSGQAMGGTGKSLVGQAIQKIVYSLQKDGKALITKGNRFFFQDVNLSHRLMVLDDVTADFNFEDFFSVATGQMTVEEKYKGAYSIPFELSPKLLITSNYMIKGSGGESDQRRRIEVEIGPYFSLRHTPFDEFGKRFFSDWTTEEWNNFYIQMLKYCQKFLQEGIKRAKAINLAENQLKVSTDPSFVEFLDSKLVFQPDRTEIILDKSSLYEDFREDYPVEGRNLSTIKFKKWLDVWAISRGLNIHHYKSDGRAMVRLYIQC